MVGKVVKKLDVIGECPIEKTGTKVTFLPDDEIFEETIFDFDTLKNRFREMAFLTKGLKIIKYPNRNNDFILKYKHKFTFH